MCNRISREIYKLKFSESALKTFISSIIASELGLKMSSKLITWLPVIGNTINATVAGSVTYAVGNAFIRECEKMI